MEKLEQIETIKLAHPFNKGFNKVYYCETEEEAMRVAGGESRSVSTQESGKSAETDLNDPNAANETREEDDSKIKVYTATYYIGLEINSGKLTSKNQPLKLLLLVLTLGEEISKQIDISWASQEFFDFCKNSNIYDPEQHSIHIHLTRRYIFSDFSGFRLEGIFVAGATRRWDISVPGHLAGLTHRFCH